MPGIVPGATLRGIRKMNTQQKARLQILLIQFIRREFPDLPNATDKGTVKNSFALSLADAAAKSIDEKLRVTGRME